MTHGATIPIVAAALACIPIDWVRAWCMHLARAISAGLHGDHTRAPGRSRAIAHAGTAWVALVK